MILEDTKTQTERRVDRFFSNIANRIYILGTNKYGLSTAQFLEKKGYITKGFLNDYANNKTYQGYRIYETKDIEFPCSIINCIIEGKTIEANNKIKALKPNSFIDYFALSLIFTDEILKIDFFDENESISDFINEYNLIYKLLEDETSKKTFSDITNFRYNKDIKFLSNFSFRTEEQYFENFIMRKGINYFIDGGGYDGTTTLKFINTFPNYKKILFFEPEFASMNTAKNKLLSFKNIEYYSFGLYNETKNQRFNNSLGPASKFDTKGSIIVKTIKLDDLNLHDVDFIKLDVEGAEISAIKGSIETIKLSRPIMAVCVYHKQSDFFNVPNLLLEYNNNYKIYIRHYTQGLLETVMYFV